MLIPSCLLLALVPRGALGNYRGRAASRPYVVRRILGAVPRLSLSDYESVLAVLRDAGEVDGAVAFPKPVLEAVRRLIPCDVVTYHDSMGGEPAVVSAGEPRGAMPADYRPACKRYWHQDGLAPRREPAKSRIS